LRPEIHVVCFLTRYRSACAEYNLFPIKSKVLERVEEAFRAQGHAVINLSMGEVYNNTINF